ncbi:MAG: nucleoside hydrolase [Anaerolineae bacterium]|nr:nucleoside hydrolase [Anaerolineae bacterium]MDW8099906.1 nucleoside hydrolase [Anaerolineae bacterium]
MPVPIILDTDIGSDVDDALALALLLASPEVELIGVTTVYGDVACRARIAQKLLRLAHREDVPVFPGAGQPISKRPVWWGGHEGEGLLEGEEWHEPVRQDDAIAWLVDAILARPGEITLVTIGPMTNAALALRREPRLAQAAKAVVSMGGVARVAANALDLPPVEHNIRCDPQAAKEVFEAGWPLTMIGLDVTMRVWITRDDAKRLAATGTPFHQALERLIERWLRFVGHDRAVLHDPLAAATAIGCQFITCHDLRVDVEVDGSLLSGATVVQRPSEARPANARVALDVDADAFVRFYLERVSNFHAT